LIDNAQLSLYLGYKRKVSYSHYSHIQSYKCIRVLCSSGSLCLSSHVCPTKMACGTQQPCQRTLDHPMTSLPHQQHHPFNQRLAIIGTNQSEVSRATTANTEAADVIPQDHMGACRDIWSPLLHWNILHGKIMTPNQRQNSTSSPRCAYASTSCCFFCPTKIR
jgi:hypothetical protein